MKDIETMAQEQNTETSPKVPIMAEVAWADPMRLFSGSEQIQQYNPSLLITRKGYQIIDKMRKDDQIKASMRFKKHAVFSTGYEIKSPENQPDDWEPKVFLEKCFEQMEGSLYASLLQCMTSLEYGFSVSEKVYENRDIGFGNQVVLKAIKSKKPHSFELIADEFGGLKKLKQYQLSGGWAFAGSGVELPIEKFVVFVNDMEWGNWYGESDLEAAYRHWWIKDNAYKWYAMLLERRGIPPIFALYNPNDFHPGLVDDLKEVMNSIQAATTGVIPRTTPQGLEFWAPQLAQQAADVFQKAIDMFNRDISRALLMPGLLGFTPDQTQGSFARSKVHFDVFMMVITSLRSIIEDKVIFEQIIKPLLDLNYPNLKEYPKFKFKPLTEEVRLDLMDRWITAVEKGVVVPQKEDEEHVRTVLDFPEKQGEEVASGPKPPETPKQIPIEKPVVEKNLLHQVNFSLSRTPNQHEQRIDFARIEGRLQQLEDTTKKELQKLLTDARDALIGFVDRNKKELPTMVKDLRLKGWNDIQSVLGEFLKQAYDIGLQEMNTELGHLQMAEVRGPMFTPTDALRFLRSKTFYISSVLKEQILKEAKAVIFNAIKIGEIPTETQQKLKQLFEPYVGNEDVIKPDKDGVMRALQPYRIETILRTNATDAFNQGRLIEGRRLGKFVQGYQYSAIIDARTTEICRKLDGRIFRADDPDLEKFSPPNHFSCRSLLVAIPVGEEIRNDEFITGAEKGTALDMMDPGFGGNITKLEDDNEVESFARGNFGHRGRPGHVGGSGKSGTSFGTGSVVNKKPLSETGTNGVNTGYKVEFEDGTKGCFKPEDGESASLRRELSKGTLAEREVFAHELDRDELKLGVVPETVMIEIEGKKGSLQKWINDTGVVGGGVKTVSAEEFGKVMIFDTLMGNRDRHGGNWIEKEGKIYGIDNGLILGTMGHYSSNTDRMPNTLSFLGKDMWGENIPPHLIDKIKDINPDRVAKKIEKQFGKIEAQYFLSRFMRLDQLIKTGELKQYRNLYR